MSLLNNKTAHITLIVTLGIFIYANSINAPFYFDDYLNIVNFPLIKNLAYFYDPESAGILDGSEGFLRRYFAYLTFALNYKFNGLHVTGYHIVNISIHLLTSCLVYQFVILTLRTPLLLKDRDQSWDKASSVFTALLAALLFLVHPIQTQAITYIVQRFSSLATMFFLLSLVCYIRARLTQFKPFFSRKDLFATFAWQAAGIISAILAMRSKEIAFTLPFVVLIYEYIFIDSKFKGKILAVAPIVIASAIMILSSIFSVKSLGEITYSRLTFDSHTTLSRWDYLFTQCRVIVTYLRLLLMPAGQRLDYDYQPYHSFFSPGVILSFMLLVTLFSTAIYCLVRSRKTAHIQDDTSSYYRIISFGIFWFFITLSIESSFILPTAEVIYEHRLYLPSIGFFMAVSAMVCMFGGSHNVIEGWPRGIIICVVSGIILILAGMTISRNQLWNNEVSFWQDNSRKSPKKARVYSNLGRALERRNNLIEAENAYLTARALDPTQSDSLINLGLLYMQSDRFTEAIANFRVAISLKTSDLAGAHNNLGIIYGKLGQFDEALKEFEQAAGFDRKNAEVYNNIGYLHSIQGRLNEALEAYGRSIHLNPGYELAFFNRGAAYWALNRQNEAFTDFRRVLEINPANKQAADRLQWMSEKRN